MVTANELCKDYVCLLSLKVQLKRKGSLAKKRGIILLDRCAQSHHRLEALSVDDGWAGFVVFGLGDPHLLEGGEGGEDGSADPDGVLSLWWGNDLDLHGGRGKGSDFLLHTVGDAWEHGGAAGEDGVGVEVLTDVDVALHDRVVGALVDAGLLHAEEGRLEEGFWASESLVTDGDDLAVRKFVRLFEGRGRGGGLHLGFKVEGDVCELFLDVTDDFSFGGGGERVATFGENLHHVVGQVTAGKVKTEDGVWERVAFVDWHGVGDTITGVEDDAGSTARRVEREDGLDGDVHGWGVKGFEHDLGHLLTVSLWVERGLGEEDWVLFWGDTKFVVEGVVPDLFHVVPVGHDAVLNWVLEGQDTTLGLGFVANVRVLLAHADHDTLVTWTSDNGREDGPWGVVTGKAGLAHTGAVIDNERSNFFVSLRK